MTEPGSAAVAVSAVAGVGLASLMPGVDGNAVVGAFAGALFFVVFAGDLRLRAAIGYLLASWVFGYFAAGEIVSRAWASTSGIAAFFAAMLCVVICTGLLEWLKGGKAPFWLRFILNRGSKQDG